MRKIVAILLLVLAAIVFDSAYLKALGASHYIRSGQSGTGASWSDALDDLPPTLVRGDTYYVADGDYSGRTFNTANSGSTYIYIKKAIAASHGTETGWSSSYGDGVANFGPLTFSTSYYVFDGQVGGGYGSWATGHGFKIYVATNSSSKLITLSGSQSHISVLHTKLSYDYNDGLSYPAGNPAVATSQDAIYGLSSCSYITFSYCYWNRPGRTALLTRSYWDHIIIEHSYFRDITIGYADSSDQHGEIWSCVQDGPGALTNSIIRWNWISGSGSTGGWLLSGTNNVFVYGNVFGPGTNGSNGLITNWSAPKVASVNLYAFNNTFVDADNGIGWSTTSQWYAYNNLFIGGGNPGWSGVTHDYSASNIGISETHSQSVTTTILSNYSGGDYALSGTTSAGLDLSTQSWWDTEYCSQSDMLGNTRGADGTWDRGAFEYTGVDISPPIIGTPTPASAQACESNPQSVLVSVPTNENATMKYDFSDTTYALMSYTFSSTGGTTHTQSINVPCDSSRTIYLRSQDGLGNTNTISTVFTISVLKGEVISLGSPDIGAGSSMVFGAGSGMLLR